MRSTKRKFWHGMTFARHKHKLCTSYEHWLAAMQCPWHVVAKCAWLRTSSRYCASSGGRRAPSQTWARRGPCCNETSFSVRGAEVAAAAAFTSISSISFSLLGHHCLPLAKQQPTRSVTEFFCIVPERGLQSRKTCSRMRRIEASSRQQDVPALSHRAISQPGLAQTCNA